MPSNLEALQRAEQDRIILGNGTARIDGDPACKICHGSARCLKTVPLPKQRPDPCNGHYPPHTPTRDCRLNVPEGPYHVIAQRTVVVDEKDDFIASVNPASRDDDPTQQLALAISMLPELLELYYAVGDQRMHELFRKPTPKDFDDAVMRTNQAHSAVQDRFSKNCGKQYEGAAS